MHRMNRTLYVESMGKTVPDLLCACPDKFTLAAFFLLAQDNRSIPDKMRETIAKREWSYHDFSLPHFVTGFECFVCEKVGCSAHLTGLHLLIVIQASTPGHQIK